MRTQQKTSQEHFLWGAATSSHQIEGYNEKNDWWRFESEGQVEGGVRSGAATDHVNRFKEDIRLAKELGINAYRFSIEWSRIEPEKGHFDVSALDWYGELINECLNSDITPMATLHHFTSPMWFADEGGFSAPDAARTFAYYTQKVADAFIGRVPYWCTINEPMVLALGGYVGKFMPPGLFAPRLLPRVILQLLESHKKAYEILHKEFDKKKRASLKPSFKKLHVGYAHNFIDFLPDRSYHPIEQITARYMNQFYNWAWLDATAKGRPTFKMPLVGLKPRHLKFDPKEIRTDFVGVNYYTKGYVQWRPRDSSTESIKELPLGLAFARRTEPQSDLGWAIHPKGFNKILEKVRSYGIPIFITENGIDDRKDIHRSRFLVEHLKVIAGHIADGADIRGYFHWSLLDNFEWVKGFGPRFGLYYVDYNTFERTPTKAASLYKEIIKHHKGSSPSRELLSKYGHTFGT